MWAIATYDFGLSLAEFEDITPTQFRALRLRQRQEFKNQRYVAAITASAIYNVNRVSDDSPILDPIDFVTERDPYEENTKEIKKLIKQVIGSLPQGTAVDKLYEIRTRTIESLKEQGRADAEQLFDECWPSLKR